MRLASIALVVAVALARTGPAGAVVPGNALEWLGPGSRHVPGLGGDPFPASVRDHAHDMPSPGRLPPLELSARHRNLPGQALPATRWAESTVGFAARHPLTLDRRAGLSLSGARPSWREAWAGTSSRAGTDGSATRGTLGMWWGDRHERALVQGEVAIGNAPAGPRAPDAGLALALSPTHWSALHAEWRKRSIAEPMHWDAGDGPRTTLLDLASERSRAEMRVHLPLAVTMRAAFDRAVLGNGNAASPSTLRLHGQGSRARVSGTWGGPRAIHVGWTHASLALAGAMAWDGQDFARLDGARLELDSRLLAFQTPCEGGRIVVELEDARMDWRARASVESWPFTSGYADLLGLRRLGRTTGAVDWTRVHLGFDHRTPTGVGWSAGVTGYRAAPSASLVHWSPAFLVFGVTDLRDMELDVDRLRLGMISLGAGHRIGSCVVSAALDQWVFADTHRSDRHVPTTQGSGSPTPTTSKAARTRWPIGTFLELRLAYEPGRDAR